MDTAIEEDTPLCCFSKYNSWVHSLSNVSEGLRITLNKAPGTLYRFTKLSYYDELCECPERMRMGVEIFTSHHA